MTDTVTGRVLTARRTHRNIAPRRVCTPAELHIPADVDATHVYDVMQLVGRRRGRSVSRVTVKQAEVVVGHREARAVRPLQRAHVDVRRVLVTLTLASVHSPERTIGAVISTHRISDGCEDAIDDLATQHAPGQSVMDIVSMSYPPDLNAFQI